jgi:curved DNA-binding protein CbpA
MNTLYNLLGIPPDADNETLKKAFREAVKATHPDIHADDPDALSRFRRIVAANALLRDAKQRATYDWLLEQRFRHKLDRQRQSKLEPRRVRLKRMRIIVPQAIGVVLLTIALVHGYRLLAPVPTTTLVAVKQNDKDSSADVAAVRADRIKGDKDEAGEAVETAGAQLTQPAPSRDESGHKHDRGGVANAVSRVSTGASAANSGDVQVIAGRELAVAPPASDASLYRERAIASYRSGDLAHAIAKLDEAIRLDPDNAQGYHIRANAWNEMGVFDRAVADYDEAIRIDPNNAAVFHDRSTMWQRKGKFDMALVDLDRAIRLSFADASIYCDRGLVWYEKGRRDRAIADFNHAIKLDPGSAAACISRGLISQQPPTAGERVPIWPDQRPGPR